MRLYLYQTDPMRLVLAESAAQAREIALAACDSRCDHARTAQAEPVVVESACAVTGHAWTLTIQAWPGLCRTVPMPVTADAVCVIDDTEVINDSLGDSKIQE
jgi:hypothetical protein